MKKIIFFTLIFLVVFPLSGVSAATIKSKTTVKKPVVTSKVIKKTTTKKVVAKKTVAKAVPVVTKASLLGNFVIQKESYNRLWYANPDNGQRYYIKDNEDLTWLVDRFSIIISATDLARFAPDKNKNVSQMIIKKYKGRIVAVGNDKNNAWYIDPQNNTRYRLDSYNNFYQAITPVAPKISNASLRLLAMNNEQLTFDASFPGVAYVEYDGSTFTGGYNNDMILPIASLSKLMTAMVLWDLNLDFNKVVTITSEEINYPRRTVGDGATSEVALKAGDKARAGDLWVAMLNASSNQSAVILADNSGVSRQQFVNLMNQKAKDLGLKKTKFQEMTGLSPNNISTPNEMAIIAKAAFANSQIAESTQVANFAFYVTTASGGSRKVDVANRNYSLLAMGADASKTGFLVEAQRNVVAQKDGHIAVVMHALSMTQRNSLIKKLLFTGGTLSFNK
ncbi:MAG: serine hydrolase [Patescibacteria group bacterium]